jgi:hypothetical protein
MSRDRYIPSGRINIGGIAQETGVSPCVVPDLALVRGLSLCPKVMVDLYLGAAGITPGTVHFYEVTREPPDSTQTPKLP